MRLLKIVVSSFWISLLAHQAFSQADENQILTPDSFLEKVLSNHPEAQKAGLQIDKAKFTIRSARGGFDPVIYGEHEEKKFHEKDYFNYTEAGVKVPTIAGLTFQAGFEQNSGIYQNPDQTVPDQGLGFLGVSVPLGQGFIIDERRKNLRKANAEQEVFLAKRQNILNDLLYESMLVYWQWVGAHQLLQLSNDFYDAAFQKFDNTRTSFIQGDKAAIDTTEAFIQVQEGIRMQLDAQIALQNASLALENFLWNQEGGTESVQSWQPVAWSSQPFPKIFNEDSLMNLVTWAEMQHPEILMYRGKALGLDVERAWKAEKLKPKVNLKYQLLAGVEEISGDLEEHGVYRNNFKWGLDLKFPVFLRKERGDLQLAKIKISETQLNWNNKRQQIRNKIIQYYQQWKILENQVDVYTETVALYTRMRDAERIKFDNGESSLFLLNSREQKWVQAKQKLIQLQQKYWKAYFSVLWASGQIGAFLL